MKTTIYILIGIIVFSTPSLCKNHLMELRPMRPVMGDSLIGVITLKETYSKNDTITVLNCDGSVWYRFSLYYDDSDGIYDFQNTLFKPLGFNPDTYSLALSVVSRKGNKFQVIVNEETRLKKCLILDNNSPLVFKTCAKFLTDAFAISYDETTNPILISIGGTVVDLKKTNNYLIRPLKVKNDWLKIQYEDLLTNTKTEGWIKWRDKNKIIIQVHDD